VRIGRQTSRRVPALSSSALLIQLLNGLASAASLFLVSAGLSLIFGVTRIVNFAHGSLYMLGAYVAYSLIGRFGATIPGYWLAVLAAALAVGAVGLLIEVAVLRRIYHAPELLQLIATFGLVLIIKDVALSLWGPEDLLGPRAAGFRGAVEIAGGTLPQYDLLLILVGPAVLIGLWWLLKRTRWGMLVRAATENRAMAQALGIDQAKLISSVFFLGALLAGLAGALQLPRESANLSMDLSVIAEAFVVTVVGGLGSIPGAFVAALIIGLVKALCIGLGQVEIGGFPVAFPKLTLVAEFVVMAVVLALRPHGLLGAPSAVPATTPVAEQRALVRLPGRRSLVAALVAIAVAAILPALGDEYDLVLATDILVFALFAASLQLMMGVGGLASFGHAAYFGLGAYAAALAARHGMPIVAALALAPAVALLAAIVFGWFCVRLSGVYLAMLTLAFAQIVWSVAFQWESFTGGSNGLAGVWPPEWLAGKPSYFYFTLVVASAALLALAWIAATPFGYALRAGRDSALRAEASGIDVRATQWSAFAIAGAFAGLAGVLYAFSKGSISPETLAIPRSIDALVMVLLGGLNAPAGPLLGAAAFIGLQDWLLRTTEYWRSVLGAMILVLVLAFPMGIGGALSRLLARLRR
jgi:branched-chain amino acid transport system permease protein